MLAKTAREKTYTQHWPPKKKESFVSSAMWLVVVCTLFFFLFFQCNNAKMIFFLKSRSKVSAYCMLYVKIIIIGCLVFFSYSCFMQKKIKINLWSVSHCLRIWEYWECLRMYESLGWYWQSFFFFGAKNNYISTKIWSKN